MTFTFADLIVCCFISGAIGYFWAIYRTGELNVTVEKLQITNSINMREFWDRAEAWRARQQNSSPEKGRQGGVE